MFDSSNPDSPASTSLAVELEELAESTPIKTIHAARGLLLDYGRFVAAQSGVASFCFGALEHEAANLPHSYLDQRGGAILATQLGSPTGFVAWRTLPRPELADAWELKRLWTTPESRGSGVGRVLVQAVIDRARAVHKSRILLDTEPQSMSAAVRLYRQLGFVDREPYNGRSPDGIIYLEKRLEKML